MSTARRLNIGGILSESFRLYAQRAAVLLPILLVPAVAIAAVSIAFYSAIAGFSFQGATMDGKTFLVNMDRLQLTLAGVCVFFCAIVTALAMAASVHTAAGASSLRAAFSSITAKSMQIFWLQCVVYALALRFSPWAGLLLWLGVGFATVVALREDLGPNDAADRAWTISGGHRLPILILQSALTLLPALVLAAIGFTFLLPVSPLGFDSVPPVVRAAISWILLALVLAPVQFTFVVLTAIYRQLTPAQPVLHARAASNVRS